jgi:hypothetical protein
MFAASKTDSVSGAAPDDKFNYVTMLLHGDGTNGAQNNTFLDSSTNNFTITRNGNTTQGSFSPYGSNWSNYLGISNSIYISTSSVFAFTAAFTVEAWVFPNSTTGGGADSRLIDIGGGIDILFVDSTKAVQVKNNGTTVLTSSSSAISLNTWSHIAVVRNGSTLSIYVNGTSVGSATYSTTFSDAGDARIARREGSGDGYLDGYISNLRIVKGSAVYTGSFTPSTTPLTAITNTVLLTCQSNRFVDNSASPFGLTPSGTPSVQRFNPFGTSTAYSTSVIGGSGYFDGSGDSLSLPNNVALDFGTGDFTIEVWIYPTSLPTSYQCVFITCDNVGSGGGIGLFTQSTGEIEVFEFVGNSAIFSTSGFNLKTNQWTNIAITRSGSTNTLYKNGVSFATATNSANYNSSTNTVIGNSTTASQTFYGYISALRVLKGTAQAPTITTPPTNITNTSLLLSMTNGAIFDNAMMNDLETVGDAKISTSVKKYGTGSLLFDGNDLLLAPHTPNMNFGSGDFTIEAWVYRTNESGTNNNIFQKGITTSSNFQLNLSINPSNQLFSFYSTDGSSVTSIGTTSTTIPQTTWTHVAVSRSGNTWRYFINGTLETTTTAAVTLFTGTGLVSVGANPEANSGFYGYIDDLRVTRGYARYTASFTPPTAAFSDTGPY